ncbi:cytochrome c3 family protein [Pseudodesulfovibrio indicus]|uniref:cytochrome c3 family protein n=1 Tax=Pseudodesulfovibrio indicus TaxID=1716143 RepID=UPI002930A0D5|nr:cytochrome c3 family protein [Pseudodesulfovibrio indicus]
MQKRYLPIAIVTGILFLVALGGYLAPAGSGGPPVRVLLENKGGKVILNHADHINDMDGQCADCHHTSGDDANPPACTDCHAAKFDAAFAANHQTALPESQCASCHHAGATIDNFSHDDHMGDLTGGDCQACHHDTDIEAKPQACSNCHLDGSNSVPRLRDAAHERCADCHQDFYDDGLKGCANCHVRNPAPAGDDEYRPCGACHTVPTDQLVPPSMAAFHGQCRGCHEKNGSGPFADDACYQCHMQ